jgi:hypothetical protein
MYTYTLKFTRLPERKNPRKLREKGFGRTGSPRLMAPPPGPGEGGVVWGGREGPDDVGEGEGGTAGGGAAPGAAAAGQNPSRPPDWEKETKALAEDGERGARCRPESRGRCRPERDAVGGEGGAAAGRRPSGEPLLLRGRERRGR